jgi:hypothetical protein
MVSETTLWKMFAELIIKTDILKADAKAVN